MKVYLCEKPAQARDIASASGRPELKEGFLQVGDAAFTWCVGHLYAQAEPDEYHPDYRRWSLDHLPIVPEAWKLKPRDRVRKQISAIRKLLAQAQEVVIATDPDREGEVIGREVLEELRWQGPVRRLLLNALDAASIRKGLAAIQDGKKTEALYQAGLGRSRADWLVGMNLTRAWTLVGRARGAEGVTPIGRVQTPTLNLVVTRDLKIENFTPSDYFTVEAACRHPEHGAFAASWKPDPAEQEAVCDSEGRCIRRAAAEHVAGLLRAAAQAAVTGSECQRKQMKEPLPPALSDLQQLGSRRWGYGAKQVLEIAQALYEKHKAISYPRSDSGYLPEDQFAEAGGVIAALRKSLGASGCGHLFEGIDPARKSRAWNDARVTAHHGIIPTLQAVDAVRLDEAERNIYRAVAERYLMQFLPDHEYEAVRLELDAGGTTLEAKGKKTLIAGWKAIEGGKPEPEAPPVPHLRRGEAVAIENAKVTERQTKPPARHTEGTLIRAMTRVAAEVEDPGMRAILREHDGIGTEATRAEIIQTLKSRGFVEARGKSLQSTARGRELIAAVPEDLKDPSTTAVMERMLSEVAEGKASLAQFMARQEELVAEWVREARSRMPSGRAQPDAPGGAPAPAQKDPNLGECPECGKALQRRRGKFGAFVGCSGYPDCRYIRKGGQGASRQPAKPSGKACAVCGSAMVVRKGRRGEFLGCSNYPRCRHTAQAGG